MEQLLQQRLGKVNFELPFSPNEKVDGISFDLTVEGINQFVDNELELDLGNQLADNDLALLDVSNMTTINNNGAHFALDLPDAREYKVLPTIISGSYVPEQFPESGILYTSQGDTWSCFEHYFRPPDLTSMAKNIVFVVDTEYGRSQIESY